MRAKKGVKHRKIFWEDVIKGKVPENAEGFYVVQRRGKKEFFIGAGGRLTKDSIKVIASLNLYKALNAGKFLESIKDEDLRSVLARYLKDKKVMRSKRDKKLLIKFCLQLIFDVSQRTKKLLIDYMNKVPVKEFRKHIELITLALENGLFVGRMRKGEDVLEYLKRVAERKWKIKIPGGMEKVSKAILVFSINNHGAYGFDIFREAVNAYVENRFREWKFSDLSVPKEVKKRWVSDYRKRVSIDIYSAKNYLRVLKKLYEDILKDKIVREIFIESVSAEELCKRCKIKDIEKVRSAITKIKSILGSINKLLKNKAEFLLSEEKARRIMNRYIYDIERALKNINRVEAVKVCEEVRRKIPTKHSRGVLFAESSANFEDLLFTGIGSTFESCIAYNKKNEAVQGLIGIVALPFVKNLVIKDQKGNVLARITIALGFRKGKLCLMPLSHFYGSREAINILAKELRRYSRYLGIGLLDPKNVIQSAFRGEIKFPKSKKKCYLYGDLLGNQPVTL